MVDAADPADVERLGQVQQVLATIGAAQLPTIQVYNKTDILGVEPRVDRSETGMPARVWLSAATGAGVDFLLYAIAEYLHRDVVRGTVRLSAAQARLRARLYECSGVRGERVLSDGSWEMDVELDQAGFLELQRSDGLRLTPATAAVRPATIQ